MRALDFARVRGIPGNLEIECAGNCTNTFQVKDGFPWSVKITGEDTPRTVLFCSAKCVLVLLDPCNCVGGTH
jgi:hypothetical protein